MPATSRYLDLSKWKVTLPIDKDGKTSGVAVELDNVGALADSAYLYNGANGTLVFKADAHGATTINSHYARSELREMNGTKAAAWSLKEGGTMTATLQVDGVPLRTDGSAGRMVIGQIHGKDNELVRLYYENGSVYFVNDQAGTGNKETTFLLKNAAGEVPKVSLGENFSYKIDAHGSKLVVSVYADGQTYTSETAINSIWNSDSFYFKAGVYLGINETNGSGIGQASFYGIDFSHATGGGLGGLLSLDKMPTSSIERPPAVGQSADKDSPTLAAAAIAGSDAADTLTGTAADDTIYGRGGNDTLSGGGGNDILWGNGGDDTLTGGAGDDWLKGSEGKDTLIFDVGHGNDVVSEIRTGDTLLLSNALFNSADAFYKSVTHTATGLKVQTGTNSSITFTDATMSDLTKTSIKFFSSPGLMKEAAPIDSAASAAVSALNFSLASAPKVGSVAALQLADGGASATLKAGGMVFGGSGGDQITGSGKADVLSGGAGNDTISGGTGDDWLFGDSGDDTLTGFTGADRISGGDGKDILNGGDGNDILVGGSEADQIYGGAGADVLWGGSGKDRILGGAGKDLFFFSDASEGGDTLPDFETGVDKLVLKSAGFGGATQIWDQSYVSIHAAELADMHSPMVIFDSSGHNLFYDADGIGGAAMQFVVQAESLMANDISFA